MKTNKTTKDGIEYLNRRLRVTKNTTTWATFWKIRHRPPEVEEIQLKIARYNKSDVADAPPDNKDAKNGLTLTGDEFQGLLEFLWDDYGPFKNGFNKYIPIDGKFHAESINYLKAIIDTPEKQKVLDFIAKNDFLADELLAGLQNRSRVKAVHDFESMLVHNLPEQEWQKWFERNAWALGTEFVRILDERKIDIANVPDYLMETYDGFLDIVEIKKPQGNLQFWADAKDHKNYVQSSSLTKAVTQAINYIFERELEANNVKFLERIGAKAIKPRCILIFGRSDSWNDEQKEAYRILNSSYHNLTIMTYDHVLTRAKRILDIDEPKENQHVHAQVSDSDDNDDDFPF